MAGLARLQNCESVFSRGLTPLQVDSVSYTLPYRDSGTERRKGGGAFFIDVIIYAFR